MLGAGVAEAMLPLMTLMHLVDKTMLSVRRLQQVLALPVLPEPPTGHPAAVVDASVHFDAVDFRYESDSTTPTLAQIDFCAAPGTVTALVGPSGAGKTTVARLIPRFWDVAAGRVRVGGADVRHLSADALMAQVAFVFQDTFLFACSLADNIRLGRPGASLDEVQAAARAAQAHDFITALPQGYDTPAGDRGVFLSGGQRQRITIARAILQNRPILVLDEATAFADPENEAALVQALSALMRGKTVIMVAHRLSTIRDADQILVMDQGRIVEHGRHVQLLDQHGLYARLWTSHEQAQHWALRSSEAAP
jgi:ATP-binding cassette subfamily B protein